MSRQRKYGRAAYSRPGMQWLKKILKWPLMFFAMVQIWLWKRKTGVIVNVCILEESEQGTKAGGGAVPWKQLWQFWKYRHQSYKLYNIKFVGVNPSNLWYPIIRSGSVYQLKWYWVDNGYSVYNSESDSLRNWGSKSKAWICERINR